MAIYTGKHTETFSEVVEIAKHFHNKCRWLGNGAVEDSLTGYTVISGNGIFGSETVLLTSIQTPIDVGVGNTLWDLNRVFPLTLSSATAYIVRWIWGTGTVGDAEAARQYSESIIMSTGLGANVRGSSTDIMMPRLPIGTKLWAKCKNATNLATITMIVGIHEYLR